MVYPAFASRRSTVLSKYAAVATSDPIATEVGLSLIKKGGNAADAAVGIAAVLNLVDPGSTGLGGDCFVMFYDAKTKTVKGINGSGRSPGLMTLEILAGKGISRKAGHFNIPTTSPFSVTVPGAPAAWCETVEMFGNKKLTMEEILQPAITLCKEGYPVHEWSAYLQNKYFNVLQKNSFSFADDILLNGKPPNHGDVVRNEKLAATYELLGKEGKEPFYKGKIAQSIVNCVQQAGGCLTMEDMAEHQSTFDQPISTEYKGKRIWEMPPNGQGLVALMTLNILKGFDLSADDRFSAETMHRMIEATHLAFADGFRHIADGTPKEVVEKLLSEHHAEERRTLIKNDRVASEHYFKTGSSGPDTVYFSVVDEEGNACSFINSIYHYHGCGLVPKDCGFVLNSRACNFSFIDKHPNCVGPRKRTYHTIIPGMVTHAQNNDLYACFGIMGGFMQPQAHVQVMSNLLDYQIKPQQAICAPRFCIEYYPEKLPVVNIEVGVPEDTIRRLKSFGHNIKIVEGMDRIIFGRGQLIITQCDSQGNRVLWSASESRADGCAMGY